MSKKFTVVVVEVRTENGGLVFDGPQIQTLFQVQESDGEGKAGCPQTGIRSTLGGLIQKYPLVEINVNDQEIAIYETCEIVPK